MRASVPAVFERVPTAARIDLLDPVNFRPRAGEVSRNPVRSSSARLLSGDRGGPWLALTIEGAASFSSGGYSG